MSESVTRTTVGPSLTPEQYQAMIAKPKRSKYRAVPTVYNGVRYASKAEAGYAAEIETFPDSWYLRQPRFVLGVPENVYVPDFLVMLTVGETVPGQQPATLVHAVDVKGMETPKFRRDCKLWARYGPCPLHIVKAKGAGFETVRVVEGKRYA